MPRLLAPLTLAALAMTATLSAPASAAPGIYSYVQPRSYDTAECMRRAKILIGQNPSMNVVTDSISVLLQATNADVSYNIRCDIPGSVLLITAGTDDLVARMDLLRRVFGGAGNR